ncbi:hypothetical protein PEC106568_19390 [Pectobacterium carotovorum subsp. carotovorum]|nr:hypothetical protein PEC106568_19390 [Pectobacterium carotovorum subsp. carotovorum]
MFELLNSNELPSEDDALRFEIAEHFEPSLPSVSAFNSSELVEALFLEESKPIVMFDAPEPEWIALRLLLAVWPSIRQRYAVSTFALSPRKIDGRDFDLVFSPSNAKSRFTDWAGRRVDGKSPQIERHRWTKSIVKRIFEEPIPNLLAKNNSILFTDKKIDSLGGLRVALLWDELFEKLPQTPTAALGLLDIANSGMLAKAEALTILEPLLVKAIRYVENTMPHSDAWDFVSAIIRKMKGNNMPEGMSKIEELASFLSTHDPEGALRLLQQSDPKGVISCLTRSIANGLSHGTWSLVKKSLINAPNEVIAHIIPKNNILAKKIAEDSDLIKILTTVLTLDDSKLIHEVGMVLLPFLVEDRQLQVALIIIDWLNIKQIIFELNWLNDVNNIKSEKISSALIFRAREIGGINEVRDTLTLFKSSKKINALLAQTIEPVKNDIMWIIDNSHLSEPTSLELLTDVLSRANEEQFRVLFSDFTLAKKIISHLTYENTDILLKIVIQDDLPINFSIDILHSILGNIDQDNIVDVALLLVGRCLRKRFDGDEIENITMLFGIIGDKFECRWVAKEGLGRNLSPDIASRNLIAFERSPLLARNKIVYDIDEIADALKKRFSFDLSEKANDACAKLMLDAERISKEALIRASGILITPLFHARNSPVSYIVAVLFPVAYKELAKSDEIPNSLRFLFSFFDWDRCKTARRELVRVFMSSNWKVGDLALTACRCDDEFKILNQAVKCYGGEEYLAKVENDLGRLDVDSKIFVEKLISEILNKVEW